MNEELFESRKRDHIRLSLTEASQSLASSDWDGLSLIPEALPDLNFEEVSLTVESLGRVWPSPFFISSMTGGHADSLKLNSVLAEACEQKGWLLGVGSQRRELEDQGAIREWQQLRKKYPKVLLASNIGLAQVITTPIAKIQELVTNTEAVALFIHLNPLQECLQLEGTPQFKGGLQAIEKVVQKLSVPVIVKEVGAGISPTTAKRLSDVGVAALDVSGRGGTHWGRIEGLRAPQESHQALAGLTFKDWGISTPKAIFQIAEQGLAAGVELWGSGGIRNGLQGAKCLALGAQRIGLARPFLEKAIVGPEAVLELMGQLDFELKISLFCSGVKNIGEFKQRKVYVWEKE